MRTMSHLKVLLNPSRLRLRSARYPLTLACAALFCPLAWPQASAPAATASKAASQPSAPAGAPLAAPVIKPLIKPLASKAAAPVAAPQAASSAKASAQATASASPKTAAGASAPSDPMADLRDRLNQALEAVREKQRAKDAGAPATGAHHAAAKHAAPRVRAASGDAGTGAAPVQSWGYGADDGPEHWARINADYAQCATGKRQSPIDIRDAIHVNLDPINFHYQESSFRVLDDGHAIAVYPAAGNYIEVMGRRYDLIELRFHRPGEERVNGQSYAMDAQLLHRDAQGHIAVVALLIQSGGEHPVVQRILDNLPLEQRDEVRAAQALDVKALLPASAAYSTYMGSLTTPPCTEGVLWMVMKQPIALSEYQLSIFGRLYPMNARPVQATGGRLIKESN